MPDLDQDARKPQRRPADADRRRISIAIFWLILILVIFAVLNLPRFTAARVSYSEFKNLVKASKLKSVTITGDEIHAVLSEPTLVQTLDAKEPRTVEEIRTVRLPDDQSFAKELEEKKVVIDTQQDSQLTQLLVTFVVPLGVGILIIWFVMRRLSPQRQVMSFGKSRAKVYAERETKVTFQDVAGIDEAKDELMEVIEFLKDSEPFRRLGARIPRGVLLVGPPGTGKTLLARAVAGEANVPFFSLTGSDFVEMFAGVGAARVRDLFEQAQRQSPCIVFIDELDALGKVRGAATLSGADAEREQTLNQLLSEMDGFDPNSGVVILAATNRPEILDPALLRPGRFDRQVVVDRPDLVGREAILKVHAKKIKLGPDVDLKKIAKATPGFVGADLSTVMNEAALLAGRRKRESVSMKEIEEAVERTVAGLEKKQRVMSTREKDRVAHHEAGHALVALSVPNADPVHRVSIIPRGVAALGYTLQLPQEDRYLLTRSELEDRIAVMLGGRAAERLVFGEPSTGAADDLDRALRLARRMVRDYGMTEKFGAVAWGGERRGRFMDSLGEAPTDGVSEETAREIDGEIRRILAEAETRVDGILRERKPALQAIAATLREHEAIDHDQLVKIARENGAPPVATPLPPEQQAVRELRGNGNGPG
jgi:cell division protease FtsH